MTIDACAELVRRGDPDRFISAMTAPPDLRGGLMVLYAFNLEVVRAPWVTAEPMIAEMRLQWWHDVVTDSADDKQRRAHEVAGPLADLMAVGDLPPAEMLDLINARRFDIGRDPPEDAAAFTTYIDDTSGNLMVLAARHLGLPKAAVPVVRDFAFGAGVAAVLRAVPALKAAGRRPLVDESPAAVRALAQQGLARINSARQQRRRVPNSCGPALLAGWQAALTLKRVARKPEQVTQGGLEASEFRRRFGLWQRHSFSRW